MRLRQNLFLSIYITALPWLVFVADTILPADMRQYGILPRDVAGIKGILFTPFLHGGLRHLVTNTGALFILLTVAFSYSRKLAAWALCIIVLGGGGLVWLFGDGSRVHIGSSGVIFGLIGYLLAIGVYRRDWKALLASVFAGLVYGSTLLSLLVHSPGISWSGHFFGFLSGVLAASMVRKSAAG